MGIRTQTAQTVAQAVEAEGLPHLLARVAQAHSPQGSEMTAERERPLMRVPAEAVGLEIVGQINPQPLRAVLVGAVFTLENGQPLPLQECQGFLPVAVVEALGVQPLGRLAQGALEQVEQTTQTGLTQLTGQVQEAEAQEVKQVPLGELVEMAL